MAGPTAERAVGAKVDGLADELVDFTRQLVRVPTINPPGQEYARCAGLIASRLDTLGYTVEQLPATGRPEHSTSFPRINVVGTLAGPRPGRTLHFNGHYDVVPP